MGETDRGKLGLVLMGGAMFSKSLIQFSVEGWSCVPPLLFTWGQTMMEVMKIMVTSFKRSHACTLHSVPPALQQGTDDPRLRQRLLDTHRQVWVSLMWRHCSFLLGSGHTAFYFCISRSLFLQSCVSAGSSTVGSVMITSKRASATCRSAALRAPVPVAGHC